MSHDPSLHPISMNILASSATSIVKIQPHDPSAESADILWTEHDPDGLYEGEAIYVSLERNGDWCVSFETVYTSDTATSEIFLGPEADVTRKVLAALMNSSNKGGIHK
ncbi:MAG: hypothetical protein AAFR98_12145 [Pseudomonadota bacterium]